jgi:hypothetical protein
MANVDKARVQLDAVLAKYKVKLTSKEGKELRALRANALLYDTTGKMWLTAIGLLDETLGARK